MAKEKHSADKITEDTLHELLTSINARLGHLEDIEADNRDIIIKLGAIEVTDIYKYMEGLSKYNIGDSVIVKVKREDEIVDIPIIF